MSASDNSPDFYTPEELATDVFPGSMFIDPLADECRSLVRTIVREVGRWPLTDRLHANVLDDVEVLAVPTSELSGLRDILLAISAEHGVSFVPPAEAAIRIPSDRVSGVRDVAVRATGGRVNADDPRIAAIKSTVSKLDPAEADDLGALVKGVGTHGPRLNLVHGSTELDLTLVQALIGLSAYDDDIKVAIVSRALDRDVADLHATLASCSKKTLQKILSTTVRFVDGGLRLAIDGDGIATLAGPIYTTHETHQGVKS
jgi:hypothetical protein